MQSLHSEILEQIVAQSSQGLVVVDAGGSEATILYANPAFEDATGYSLGELAGSPWFTQAAADEDSPELVRLRQCLACDEPTELSLPLLRKDGDIWLARLTLTPLAAAGHERRLWLVEHRPEAGSGQDNAELLKRVLGRARSKLASLDRTDAVTGLLSRGQFDVLLRRELAVSRREGRSLRLLLFSVPEIDVYRRTFGVNAADSCLRMIGAQISGTFRRASDLCARIDESTLAVAMLGDGEAEGGQLIGLVEKKTRNLGLHNPRGRMGRYVFVRGACVAADPATDDSDSLLARAREALVEPAASPQASAAAGSG